MLYLHVGKLFASDFDLKLHASSDFVQSHWLDHWYMHAHDMADSKKALNIFMNGETKYAFVQQSDLARPIEARIETFIHQLERYSGYNLKSRYEEVMFCAPLSSPQEVLMSELIKRVAFYCEKQTRTQKEIDCEKIEYLWNSQTLNEGCPVDRFMALLQGGDTVAFKETAVSFLKIVT